jgi:hypothetical protein
MDDGAAMNITVAGTKNLVYAGVGSFVKVSGSANTVEVLANSHVEAYSGSSVSARSSVIDIAGNVSVKGDNNLIHGDVLGQEAVLSLSGSNNVITMAKGIKIGSLWEHMDGSIEVSQSIFLNGATLVDGTLSIKLSDGNVATFASIASGTQIGLVNSQGVTSWTTIQDTGSHPYIQSTNQLVSAMASYNADVGSVTTVSASHSSNDTMFQQPLVAA